MKFTSNLKDSDYIDYMFANEEYLRKYAKRIVETDTTNDWGFDGTQEITFYFNGSSYTEKKINRYSGGENEFHIIYKINRKEVSKDEFLKHNNIRRKTTVKLWSHPVYEGKFDKLIEEYLK